MYVAETAEKLVHIVRYWCFVTSEDNWKVCKEHNVWGVDYRYYVTMKKFVKTGDLAVVYIHGGNFVAVVRVTSDMRAEFKHIGWTKKERGVIKPYLFPYRVDIEIIKEGKINVSFTTSNEGEKAIWKPSDNILDDIVFIADKSRTWNQYVQVSMIRVAKEDYDTVYAKLS